MKSNYGTKITVASDRAPLGADVLLAFATDDVLLTPTKARRLARRLLKVADEVERENGARK